MGAESFGATAVVVPVVLRMPAGPEVVILLSQAPRDRATINKAKKVFWCKKDFISGKYYVQ
jgi:hypothetical protein